MNYDNLDISEEDRKKKFKQLKKLKSVLIMKEVGFLILGQGLEKHIRSLKL